MKFDDCRRLFWHFRKGGLDQLIKANLRRKLDSRLVFGEDKSQAELKTGLLFPTAEPNPGSKPKSNLKVAIILDTFSAAAWSPEWDCTFITPDSWKAEIACKQFDLLFVESAWAGNSGSWKYHLTGTSAPRPAFVEMVAAFRKKDIPTAFWNKEDPPHFEDFLDAARLFDYVFTSDVRMIDRYVFELGHKRVQGLSFAAQPSIHNPIRRVVQNRRDVAFAGMYFAHKFPERREQMDMLLGAASDVSTKLTYGFDIFSRLQDGEMKYQFPKEWVSHVVGSLPYEQMLTAYKYYNVFLNVNSVVDSPSMCARRIFEITASGAAVVSAPSAAIGNFFDQSEVIQVADRAVAASTIRSISRSPELRDRIVHRGQRRIWQEHTYSHRSKQILDFVGVDEHRKNSLSMSNKPMVSVVAPTIRPNQIDHILASVGKQKSVETQLVLVTHGFQIEDSLIRKRASESGIVDLLVYEANPELTLGQCLNTAVSRCEGDFIAKMDDDDFYGEHYLFDQVSALRYSGASIVGKQAHYMYLADTNATLLRFAEREHKFTDLVMGPTIIGKSEVFRENPFENRSRGEDTNFLRLVAHRGGSIYSSDRFNFLQMRGNDGQAHTWNVRDADLSATGSLQWFGRNDEHIFF